MTIECLLRLPTAYVAFLLLFFRFRPTVIYLANHHEAILLWPLLLFLRKKVVCHMHDPPPAIPFQRASFLLWRLAIGRFICVSNDSRQRLSLLGRLRPCDIVVHNGVRVEPLVLPRLRNPRFCAEFNWPTGTIIVGMTGQTSPHKGHEDFIEAAALIDDPNVRFIISAKKGTRFVDSLRELRKALGLEVSVRFVEWLPSAKDFFEGIDILILPSRHEEGFGLVVAEAGERGLPVVSTRSGGAVEIIRDGVTGILVNRENPGEIANALRQLIRSKELRQSFGEAGRKLIARAFNLGIQSDRLASAFTSNTYKLPDDVAEVVTNREAQ